MGSISAQELTTSHFICNTTGDTLPKLTACASVPVFTCADPLNAGAPLQVGKP